MSTGLELYGLTISPDDTRISIELFCYRTNRQPEQGGLGAEAHFRNAFRMMWPKYEMSKWVDEMIHAWCTEKWISVIGCERASKTYSFAHILYLDYCADPSNTLVSLGTVTFDGLKLRMWSDLLRAIETASIQFPMTVRSSTNELRVFPTDAQKESGEKYQIHGMAVNNNENAQGRIRGGHAPRRRIILDEAQDVADPAYEAIVNPMSAPDARCVLLSNPVERMSTFGEWCEPLDGWPTVTVDQVSWKTRKGGICLHFDGLKSPNLEGKKKYTGIIDQRIIDEVRALHGEDSVQWWALVRGWFPPDGMVSRVFTQAGIDRAMANITFDWAPVPCASLDPAFEFDEAVLSFGELGTPVYGEKRYVINVTGDMTVKYNVSPGSEPKDYQLAHVVMRECRSRNIQPQHFIMDKTGGGRGTFAILQKEWSPDIRGIEYGGAATERPLRGDNATKCSDLYKHFVSELWFRAAECCREGQIGGLRNCHKYALEELGSRRYELKQGTKGQQQAVETKKDFKARLGRSPDHGDTFVQFAELLARLGTFPGGKMQQHVVSTKWQRQRERAKSAALVYDEANEYKHF